MIPRLSKKNDILLLISLSTLLVFVVLFAFRAMDDNRLTNWQWVFVHVDGVKIFSILILGLVSAFGLFRVSLERKPVISLFSISFVIAAIFWQQPEVIVDASRYFTQAKHLELYGIDYFMKEWGKTIVAWTDMPLIPLFYGLIFKFFGESRIYIQVFTTALFSLTVVLTYLIGKELWDKRIGYNGGLLLMGFPYLLTQIPLMLVDVPTMFLLTLSTFTFIKALKSGGIWLFISSLSIFLTFYSKYSTWLMLSVMAIIFLVYIVKCSDKSEDRSQESEDSPPTHPSPSRGEGEGWSVIADLQTQSSKLKTQNYISRGIFVALISALLIGTVFWYKFDVFSEQIRLLTSYQKPALKQWGESFVSTFFFQIHPFITAAAIYSAYAAFKKRDSKYLIIGWLIFLVIALQIRRIRYIIMVFPMFALTASYGLYRIKDKEIRNFIVSCIITSSLVISIFAYLPFLKSMNTVNLKHAGEFIDSLGVDNIEVFVLQQKESEINSAVSVPMLDIFTGKGILYHHDPAYFHPPEDMAVSPLRFTWEYKNPGYYETDGGKSGDAVAVISGDGFSALPFHIAERIKGYGNFKTFKTLEGIFQYRTIVTVYYNE
ncbi:MAG: glycosyltransferase family 39 protein [Nitrospirae bacterium]|nr:glycosyltransferase family 39 protein [Nitrospirota bacterium]